MVRRQRLGVRSKVAMALAALGAGVIVTVAGSSSADVTAVSGSAYGYAFDTTNPGGSFSAPPTPLVTLPPAGSPAPVTATAPQDVIFAGPAEIISFDGITVSTQGTTGPTGSVTSSSTINGLNFDAAEPLTATTLSSTCSASSTGVLTGSTSITGGTIQIDNGSSFPPPAHPAVTVPVPDNPAPNTVISGHLHIGSTQDNFEYVLNEQVQTADSITVNAAHLRLLGPLANGDLYIGRSVCGVSVGPTSTTTSTSTVGPTTSTTTGPTTSTTTVGPTTSSSTSTTTVGPTTSTTTVGPTTSTTTGPTTSTTTVGPTTSTTTVGPTTSTTTRPTTSTTTRPTTSTTTVGPTTSTTTSVVPPVVNCDTVKPTPSNGAPTAQADPDTVQQGDDTRVTGRGFGPGESLDLTLCSTPVSLGKVTAGPSGDVAATVTVPAGTALGTHTIVVSNADGSRVALAPITVVAPSGSVVVPVSGGGNALVRTGTDTTRMAVLAALVLIMGLGLVRAAKFRRYAAPWNRRNRY